MRIILTHPFAFFSIPTRESGDRIGDPNQPFLLYIFFSTQSIAHAMRIPTIVLVLLWFICNMYYIYTNHVLSGAGYGPFFICLITFPFIKQKLWKRGALPEMRVRASLQHTSGEISANVYYQNFWKIPQSSAFFKNITIKLAEPLQSF